ncbi:uncharacterized protein B0H18DRAFT_1113827 [Fomitopsis serialis]|uniref:uncharacterized protein n=1 Tax=Fomitopsis serialis TaxID=139415 RepID=UPI0020077B51|nr:uncharacterized protein B0H18DRAFT_1113827 [Neoantrodia serialis]KAH9936442.1 hypothetical protein B0H18DRAFT_1113827 [Neoantrodia serialis]
MMEGVDLDRWFGSVPHLTAAPAVTPPLAVDQPRNGLGLPPSLSPWWVIPRLHSPQEPTTLPNSTTYEAALKCTGTSLSSLSPFNDNDSEEHSCCMDAEPSDKNYRAPSVVTYEGMLMPRSVAEEMQRAAVDGDSLRLSDGSSSAGARSTPPSRLGGVEDVVQSVLDALRHVQAHGQGSSCTTTTVTITTASGDSVKTTTTTITARVPAAESD